LGIQLSPLIELQRLDLRAAEITDQRRKIPQRLEVSEAPLRDARKALQEATVSVEGLVKERRSHEKDLEAHEDRISKMKDRASQLKTNQEYQAHLFEVELANKKKGEIEEKILLAMESIEQLQQKMKAFQAKVGEAEKLFSAEKATLDELDRTLAAELAELDLKRQAVSAQVEKPLLARYTKLKSARKDQALAPLRGGICLGCRLQLAPQLVAEVKRMQDLHTCPYCYRMLYWEGEPATETATPVQEKVQDLEVGESA